MVLLVKPSSNGELLVLNSGLTGILTTGSWKTSFAPSTMTACLSSSLVNATPRIVPVVSLPVNDRRREGWFVVRLLYDATVIDKISRWISKL